MLAEVVAHLTLRKLGLRLLAPARAPVRTQATRPDPSADPLQLARRLLTQGAAATPEPARTLTEAAVADWATGLDTAQVHQLAHAVDARRPIRIQYQAASGGFSTRVVSELTLEPPFLVGWCHLREAERMFTLSRILSATAV